MKYHSTPKPVRIRFVSGGEEHFSLDTFCKNFNPADVINKKNELFRWLDMQGEDGQAIKAGLDVIDDLSTDHLIDIYKAFFPEIDIDDLPGLFSVMNSEKKNLRYLKELCYQDGKLLEDLYIKDKDTHELEKDDTWFSILKNFVQHNYYTTESTIEGAGTFKQDIAHPKLLFHLGRLYEKRDQYDMAKIYYQAASKHGVKDASKRLKNLEENEQEEIVNSVEFEEGDRFSGVRVYELKPIFQYIRASRRRYSWDIVSLNTVEKILNKYNTYTASLFSSQEKNILLFVLACYCIKSLDKSVRKQLGFQYLGEIKEYSLDYEIEFVKCLIDWHSNKKAANEALKQLSEKYIPALYLYNNYYKNKLLDDARFREQDFPEQIDFLLNHLFDFARNIIKKSESVTKKNKQGRFAKVVNKEFINRVNSYIFDKAKSDYYGVFSKWENGDIVIESFKQSHRADSLRPLCPLEKDIINFVLRVCQIIYKYDPRAYDVANSAFATILPGDTLRMEKCFVIGVLKAKLGVYNKISQVFKFKSDEVIMIKSWDDLIELSKEYFPAKYLVDTTCHHNILDTINFRRLGHKEIIRQILVRMFDFEYYEP